MRRTRSRAVPRLTATLLVLIALALAAGAAAAVLAQQPVQHGAQPNPGEVRPPSPEGNAPSSATGTLDRAREPGNLLGMRTGLTVILAVLVVVIVAGLIFGGLRVSARRPPAVSSSSPYPRRTERDSSIHR